MSESSQRKLVYRFESGKAEGRAEWRALLGGKGANLAEMANMGIPVPPGFTISTEACVHFLRSGELSRALLEEVQKSVSWLEQVTQKGFKNPDAPLLLSVRSGAQRSMPGMMDTILDLGLNQETLEGLARSSGSERFALDAPQTLFAGGGLLDVVAFLP